MFSFFSKKEYLIDYLEGFIDIHNHILPGIDDGAKTVEESIDLIKGFGEFGVKNFICTPHIMHNYYDNTPQTIKKSYKKLKKALKEENIKDINLGYAAEHMIDANFDDLLEKDKIMPLNADHLLIEMSYLQPSIGFEISIENIIKRQLFPVLAHPERYNYLNNSFEKYQTYKNWGVKFQLNLLSLTDYYGNDVKKSALKLLESNYIDYAGSDVHNTKQLHHLKNSIIAKKTIPFLKTIIDKNQLFIGPLA